MKLKFLDCFAGIGGFRVGLEKAGHTCVGHIEIDKFANMAYNAIYNIKEGEYFGEDITTINPTELPDFDILCGGFPCQSFSISGKQKGFEDTRGTLVFELLRIAKEKQPTYLFFENVPNLLRHDKGRTFGTILRAMDELGYDAEWCVLNGKDGWGGQHIPQNRERVFIVGHLRGKCTKQIFPIRRKDKEFYTKSNKIQIIGSTKGVHQTSHGQRNIVYFEDDIMGTLTATDYKQPKQIAVRQIGSLNNYKKSWSNAQCDRVYNIDGLSPTLNTMQGGDRQVKILLSGEEITIRKLTPKECWRLQGFSDEHFNKTKNAGLSDTQLYKQAGNSVMTNIIYEIGQRLTSNEK